MKIKHVHLINYGPFEDLKIDFASGPPDFGQVTVLAGINGAGKTILLKSLAVALSWFIARLQGGTAAKGSPIETRDIHNQADGAVIHITTEDQGAISTWTLAKAHKGRNFKPESDLRELNLLAQHYKNTLARDPNTSLPLLVFYPEERVVSQTTPTDSGPQPFAQLNGYAGALTGKRDFRLFFEWFKAREDLENESGVPETVAARLRTLLETSSDENLRRLLEDIQTNARDRQLTAVRKAITNFIPEFCNLRVRRKPHLHMVVEKNGRILDIGQLSQGEKSLMVLVGDIARRLAMMNPELENPLTGRGCVLIDEVDLHLHPRWQRVLVSNLARVFPNCQFILATHSPLVISDAKHSLCYLLENAALASPGNLYGLDVNQVLLETMDTDIRHPEVSRELDALFDLIQDEQPDKARALLNTLEQDLPLNHIELLKARLLLKKLELNIA